MCARDVDVLCTKTSLCVGSSVFPERFFFEDYFACMMAAFGEAETCSVPCRASVKDFLGGMV